MIVKQGRFFDIYEEKKKIPTPRKATCEFVSEIATLTNRTENAVKSWISGKVMPDEETIRKIAEYLGEDEKTLFA